MTKFILFVVSILFVFFIVTPQKVMDCGLVKIREIKELINVKKAKVVVYATTLFMFITHMYAWLNGGFLFDATFIYRGTPTRVLSDKWLGTFVWVIDAGINEPWLAGILSIVLMIISVYCIVDVLEIEKKYSIWMLAGVCSTNSVIICQQEYAGGNYTGEIALALACIAMWTINNEKHRGVKICVSALTIACSAGMYGAYVSLIPSLMLVKLIIDIFRGVPGNQNWKKAFSYLFHFLLGMALYYVILRGLLDITGGRLSAYMGEDNISDIGGIVGMLKFIPNAYIYLFKYYVSGSNYLPQFMSVLLLIIMSVGGGLTIYLCYCKKDVLKRDILNLLLFLVVFILLPLAINMIYVMSSGHMHFLMIFTYIVPILFFIKVFEEFVYCYQREVRKKSIIRVSMFFNAIICVYLYYSIVMANAVYVHYHNMYDTSLSLGTRILDRIETCEGYDGDETVVLLGRLQDNPYFGEVGEEEAEILDAFLGNSNPNNINVLKNGYLLELFLTNILNSKIEYVYFDSMTDYVETESEKYEYVDILNEMGSFPRRDCVRKIGNKIYFKLSDF